MLARRRREKIIHLHLIRMGLLYWPLGLEPPAGLGGSEMLSRGRGVKNGLQGGRMATYPPHAHLCGHTISQEFEMWVLLSLPNR